MTPGTRWNFYLESVRAPLINWRDRRRFAPTDAGQAPWPVHIADQGDENAPFFIVGFPRSGSTLLRGILSQHTDVFIPPENGGLGKMIAVFGKHRDAPWETVVNQVVDAFQSGYEAEYWQLDLDSLAQEAKQVPVEERSLRRLVAYFYEKFGDTHAPGRHRWGDKTMPGDCTYLYKIGLTFANAKFVHIVRDGRDAVASAMRQRMFRGDLAEAAWNWKNTMVQWRRFVSEFGGRTTCHEVRYETLVSEPQREIEALCNALDLEPQPDVLAYRGTDKLADVQAIQHHENVRKPISTASVGRSREQFDVGERRQLDRIFGRQLKRLSYA